MALLKELPTLPSDGLDELLDTVADIRDFYNYVEGETTSLPRTKKVQGRLVGSFVRTDFPIDLDDED